MPTPMMKRHMTRTPMIETAGPEPVTAWARVPTMMTMSSMPYMRLRPKTSASQPNRS